MKTEDRPSSTPEWGIEPVPERLRLLGPLDTTALWGNLGISLLLPIVAAFLVPGMSFLRAVAAIAVGVVLGNLALGWAARMGAETHVPAMVLYRPALGLRGSYAPTVLNVLQNIGWGSFELLIIGTAASAITSPSLRPVWTIAFGALVILMAVGGPLVVVRRWIRRYGVWLVLASSVYLTAVVLGRTSISELLDAPAKGGLGFWQGVDLVIAMPISWIPLVQDYTRFSRTPRAGFWGAALGYGAAHAWFYLLGVVLIMAGIAQNPADPVGFVDAVLAIPLGVVALGILAVDETDEAFANVYSASVSVQNAAPRLSQRRLSIAIGVVCTLIALGVDLVQYENFLLLIGAVFVPLFGVLAADYTTRKYTPSDLFRDTKAFRPWGVIAWLAGFVAFNWVNPGTVAWWAELWTPLPDAPSWIGASMLSFVVAFTIQGARRVFAR